MPAWSLVVFLRRCSASPPPLLGPWLHRQRAPHNGLITLSAEGELRAPLDSFAQACRARRQLPATLRSCSNPERLAKFLALDLADGVLGMDRDAAPRRTEQSSTSSFSVTDASAFEDRDLDDVGWAAITFSSSAGQMLKPSEITMSSARSSNAEVAVGIEASGVVCHCRPRSATERTASLPRPQHRIGLRRNRSAFRIVASSGSSIGRVARIWPCSPGSSHRG